MTYTKAALDAETDQVLAYIADMRGDPEAAPPPLMDIAGRMAAQLSAQFPDDPALGRIVVAAGQAMSAVAAKCEQAGMPAEQALAVLVNAVAFAGQQIAQRPGGGS